MKKDNKLAKFVAFVLLITLFALILVSNTYAKYTTKKVLSAEATVAKWSIKLNGKDITQEDVTFDLFKNIKEEDTISDEDHISKPTDKTLIAPGTGGSFDIELVNESDVDAKYSIVYSIVNNDNIPVEFTTDKSSEDNWKTDITELNNLAVNKDVELSKDKSSKTATIYWRWKFDGNDDADTKLGISANTTSVPSVTVKATLTATQID